MGFLIIMILSFRVVYLILSMILLTFNMPLKIKMVKQLDFTFFKIRNIENRIVNNHPNSSVRIMNNHQKEKWCWNPFL